MAIKTHDDPTSSQRSLVIQVRDFAPEIDAITVAPRKLDETRPGGLGTHFIREIMDEVAYLRPSEGIGNLLKMTKEIPPIL
jgi:sigma-B regulation protein RsbU (phosphoserine phosphatase)